MEFAELKRRCKSLWVQQYDAYYACKKAFGVSDKDTKMEANNLFVIEDTIREITGGLISDSDFEKWEAELK